MNEPKLPTTAETLPDRMRRREMDRLRSENKTLRLIVNTIIPQAGCFYPENEEQTERIALERIARYHALKCRVLELEAMQNASPRRHRDCGAVEVDRHGGV